MHSYTPPFFKISLAQWSLHNTIAVGGLPVLDFAKKARALNFDAVEYVSRFYTKEALDPVAFGKLIRELKTRSSHEGIQNLLIMVDGEGALASADKTLRDAAVNNHKKWVDAAAALGCHSVRINILGGPEANADAWVTSSAEGLTALCSYAVHSGLNILVENHGGLSSNGTLLAEVMRAVNLPNCGTLPDFGNFCISRKNNEKWPSPCIEEYDRYNGVTEMMPFAKGVSAKSFDFDVEGYETTIDYPRMLQIIKDSGYTGHIGIEYEGQRLNEVEGVVKTRELLLEGGRE